MASGKGGVGKSTTACNLALGLSRLGMKVGVLDADVYGPSMPKLFGLQEKPAMAADGHSLMPLEKYGVKVMSIGLLVEDDARCEQFLRSANFLTSSSKGFLGELTR